MKTDHRPPAREFGYAVLPDWQPPRRWPGWLRVLIILAGSLMAWAAILGLALAIGALNRGG